MMDTVASFAIFSMICFVLHDLACVHFCFFVPKGMVAQFFISPFFPCTSRGRQDCEAIRPRAPRSFVVREGRGVGGGGLRRVNTPIGEEREDTKGAAIASESGSCSVQIGYREWE